MRTKKKLSFIERGDTHEQDDNLYQMLIKEDAQNEDDLCDDASSQLAAKVLDEGKKGPFESNKDSSGIRKNKYRASLQLVVLSLLCSHCNRCFGSDAELKVHVCNRSVFNCDSCNKRFKQEQNYHNHLLKVHNINEPFKCDECQLFFKKKRDYNGHCRSLHDKAATFTCPICSLTFKKRFLLKTHTFMKHDDGRPYHCHLCPKMFKIKRNLRCHYRLVHTDARPYTCTQCTASFKEKNVLTNHVRVQHDCILKYECSICSKKFGYSATFKRHVLTVHEKSNRFKCPICPDTSYVNKKSLEQHMIRLHSGDRDNPDEDRGSDTGMPDNELSFQSDFISSLSSFEEEKNPVKEDILFSLTETIKIEEPESFECYAYCDEETLNITLQC